jgi:hypothetical protein
MSAGSNSARLTNSSTPTCRIIRRDCGDFPAPGSNALAAAEAVETEMQRSPVPFPPGLEYRVIYNPTKFIAQSMEAVMTTLIEAIVLVVLVIIVFLQKWRARSSRWWRSRRR